MQMRTTELKVLIKVYALLIHDEEDTRNAADYRMAINRLDELVEELETREKAKK